MRKLLCIAAIAVGGALAVPSGAAAVRKSHPLECPTAYPFLLPLEAFAATPWADEAAQADRNNNDLVCAGADNHGGFKFHDDQVQ